MKIALIGMRGVPALYGGFETVAEEIGVRLAERGHEVVAYCRKGYFDDSQLDYRGLRRIVLPSLKLKWTDTYSHSLFAMLHVLSQKPDVILAFNPGIGSLCIIPRVFGIPVALNPNGFDWKRKKWGTLAQAFIYTSAWICTKVINQLIVDSRSIEAHYNDDLTCNPPAIYIPYGAALEAGGPVSESEKRTILEKYGVRSGRYFFFLSRHVPENSCADLIRGFESLDTDMKLLFGGDDDTQYARDLRDTHDARVLFPGAPRDEREVRVLHEESYAVLHGNQPGGTSLGLLKAMGYGTCVATFNSPDNSYVIGDAGITYDLSPDNIRDTLQELLDDPAAVTNYRTKALERIDSHYNWEVVTDQYEDILARLAGTKK